MIYCPRCGTLVGGNPFFIVTGQCMCHGCGLVVDLTNCINDPEEAQWNEKEEDQEQDEHSSLYDPEDEEEEQDERSWLDDPEEEADEEDDDEDPW
ncbi:MAG: hypothetical protein SWQ30_02745 [Thermodesulfobacteriota bacterium]|nr:hypothetical protein [Thermodesulfobacteriota bacterium]